MRRLALAGAVLVAAVGLGPRGGGAQTLYGGNGFGSVANTGWLIRVNPSTGAGTTVGPTGYPGITGLAFDALGTLYGTTIDAGVFIPGTRPTSDLIRIDPNTGAVLGAVGVTFGGRPFVVNDLAIQPGTNTLFGVTLNPGTLSSSLYTINPTTGVASLVGNTGVAGQAIAFAPNGTLYYTSLIVDPNTGMPNGVMLNTLDPATAAVLTTGSTFGVGADLGVDGIGGLAVRPTDGAIFGSSGPEGNIYELTLTSATLIGTTGVGGPGDLAFAPVPEPATLLLLGAGLVPLACLARRRRG